MLGESTLSEQSAGAVQDMDHITAVLRAHYSKTFSRHGATPRGVDWNRAEDVTRRYDQMLAVMDPVRTGGSETISLLDVGCGYGGLYEYANDRGLQLRYTGIDVVADMIRHAQTHFPAARFACADIFQFDPAESFDYVVCNGILTQKLTAGVREMDAFAHRLIKKLYALCRFGVAFNLMTTKVNFMAENLYLPQSG